MTTSRLSLTLVLIVGLIASASAGAFSRSVDSFHQSNTFSRRSASAPAAPTVSSFTSSGMWYVAGGTGFSVPHINTNTYGYAPTGSGFPNDQYIRDSTQTEPLISLQGGYRFATQQQWFPYYNLGAEYIYVFNSKVNGVIDQYSNPAFQNYNYEYQIQRQTFLGVIKLDIYQWQYLLPYVTGGIGFSRNNVQDYSEQALPGVTPRVSPGYSSQASTDGSWILGAGLDIEFSKQLWGSLEYNYGRYGDAQTGNGSANTGTPGNNFSSSSLKTQLTASTFAVNIIYFFNI